MANNALIITQYFYSQGWSKEAISAMLGNMQAESSINPGIWESLSPYGGGYGLTQWTPYTKYSDWATAQGYTWQDNGDAECERIQYEANNNLQWFTNAEVGISPPITFSQFTTSTLNVDTLSNYWLWFYEHPANPYYETQQLRASYSRYWYNYIPDPDDPPDPDPPDPPDPDPPLPEWSEWFIWMMFKMKERSFHKDGR